MRMSIRGAIRSVIANGYPTITPMLRIVRFAFLLWINGILSAGMIYTILRKLFCQKPNNLRSQNAPTH